MSGNFTPVGAQLALDYLSGTMDTTLIVGAIARSTYLMLLTATPSNASSLATYPEVSAAGYARQTVSWGAAALNGASVYQIANSTAVLWGPFTGASGIGPAATMCALVTVSTGTSGTPLMLWTLDTPGSAPQNSSLQLPVGALTMTVA
jgi:hypothetical protein